MSKRSLVVLLLGSALNAGCTPPPETTPPPEACEALPAALRERIDPFVTERMRQGHIPGLSLVILQGGQPVCLAGHGVANRETSQPMDVTTRVSIGSTTKAMALMQQVEAGRVDLEVPVPSPTAA